MLYMLLVYGAYLLDNYLYIVVPSERVDSKLPSHYPTFYDYADEEENDGNSSAPEPTVAPSSSNLGIILTVVGILTFLILAIGVIVCVYSK